MPARPRYARFNLDMHDPALRPVFDFAEIAYPGQPLTAAVRELIIAGLGSDPEKSASIGARHSAYVTVSIIVRSKLAQALRDIASDLDLQVSTMREQMNKPCEVCGARRSDV